MKRFSWIISVPLLAIGAVFAVVNRQPVEVRLWPLDINLEAPLFIIVLLSLFVGFVIGGLLTWVSAGRRSRRVREEQERVQRLEREVERLKQAPPALGNR